MQCFNLSVPECMRNNMLMSPFVVFSASLCIMLLSLNLNIDYQEENLGSPLKWCFKEPQVQYVIYAIIVVIAVMVPIAWELLLDIFTKSGFVSLIRDETERLFMLLVVVIPGILMLQHVRSPAAPLIFCFLQTVQIIGSMAPILSLCMKLVPAHFHPKKVFAAYLCWVASGTCKVTGFNYPLKKWPHISVFVCEFISLVILFDMLVRCGIDICNRIPQTKPIRKKNLNSAIESMTDKEIFCFVYLSCSLITIVLVSAIIGALHLYKEELWGLKEFFCSIYSVTTFSVFSSAIPGRLRQQNARTQIGDKIKANHTTVRYISHEIRSPLNIIKSGIMLVLEQIKGKASSVVLDMITDIQDACGAAIYIADELLNLGEIEAGTFKIVKEFKPVSSLTRMMRRCQALALQKNIRLFIQNDVERSSAHDLFGIFVDSLKIEQVFLNLIANSIKFTPPHGTIRVDLKFEPLDSSSEIEAQRSTSKTGTKSFQFGKARYVSGRSPNIQVHPAGSSISIPQSLSIKIKTPKAYTTKNKLESANTPVGSICIAITDTGLGMTEAQCKKIFAELDHFCPNTLEGRGGSGLGLWICQQIMKRHDGNITFQSGGLNKGTTFSIRMDCYEWDEEIAARSPKVASLTSDSDTRLSNIFSSLNYDNSCQTPSTKPSSFCALAVEHEKPELEPVSNLVASQNIRILQTRSKTSRQFFSFVDENEECSLDTNESQKTFDIHILVVDDSALNRKVVKKSIEKAVEGLQNKYRCTIKVDIVEADDGTSAVQLVLTNQEQYSLIFMDNIMNKMNGPQAAEKMRNEGYTGHIFGVTGNVSESDIADFIEHGADGVLEKPVSLEKMSLLIERFFRFQSV